MRILLLLTRTGRINMPHIVVIMYSALTSTTSTSTSRIFASIQIVICAAEVLLSTARTKTNLAFSSGWASIFRVVVIQTGWILSASRDVQKVALIRVSK
jgi:hypothetical protein